MAVVPLTITSSDTEVRFFAPYPLYSADLEIMVPDPARSQNRDPTGLGSKTGFEEGPNP